MDTRERVVRISESKPPRETLAERTDANGAGADVYIPTRDQARKSREQDELGFLMPLDVTGGYAHVKIPPLAEITNVVGMPTEAQELVLRVFRENDEESAAAGDEKTPLTWEKLTTNQSRQKMLADGLAAAGFVVPRLHISREFVDASDPYSWHVDDVHINEKLFFMQLVMNRTPGAMERLRPFLGETLGRLEAVPVVPADERVAVDPDADDGGDRL